MTSFQMAIICCSIYCANLIDSKYMLAAISTAWLLAAIFFMVMDKFK